MEIKQEVILDSGTSDGQFSVRKQSYVEVEGKKNYLGQPDRRIFAPGEIDALKSYSPEFEPIAKAIWTQNVVEEWQQKQAKNKISSGFCEPRKIIES